MSAVVIDFADLRARRHPAPIDTRTDHEKALDAARADGYREGASEGFFRGALVQVEATTGRPVVQALHTHIRRAFVAAQLGGFAS